MNSLYLYNKSTAVHFITDHPIIGFVASLFLAITGSHVGVDGDTINVAINASWHIPPVFMEIFQMFAWTGAGVAGLAAGYGLYIKAAGKLKVRKQTKQKTDDTDKREQDYSH